MEKIIPDKKRLIALTNKIFKAMEYEEIAYKIMAIYFINRGLEDTQGAVIVEKNDRNEIEFFIDEALK